jgi:hypothetical protein
MAFTDIRDVIRKIERGRYSGVEMQVLSSKATVFIANLFPLSRDVITVHYSYTCTNNFLI